MDDNYGLNAMNKIMEVYPNFADKISTSVLKMIAAAFENIEIARQKLMAHILTKLRCEFEDNWERSELDEEISRLAKLVLEAKAKKIVKCDHRASGRSIAEQTRCDRIYALDKRIRKLKIHMEMQQEHLEELIVKCENRRKILQRTAKRRETVLYNNDINIERLKGLANERRKFNLKLIRDEKDRI